jgi:hypothetical protein
LLHLSLILPDLSSVSLLFLSFLHFCLFFAAMAGAILIDDGIGGSQVAVCAAREGQKQEAMAATAVAGFMVVRCYGFGSVNG